ncbi:MAG TPA: mobile mystery protein A [Bacteroidales bacterium]|jgi:predicted DNA-binding mobile mystery protein A|nr:mobile mystery protein A [Bacteroidales bacterium]HPI87017.1 mobile mystery protein A [Bacteroidales bacterium]HPM93595.1 mobile mystery protein A [Bacteroidales bacterium]
MKNSNQKLIIEQVDRKLQPFKSLDAMVVPPKGWINTVRTALRMSLRQLGNRLNISPQSVKELENREANGSLTIKSLKEAGLALNLRLVYGFIPMDGSIEKMIEARAFEVAREIVARTSQSMKLENQENKEERLKKAIEMKAREIMDNMPKYLWE